MGCDGAAPASSGSLPTAEKPAAGGAGIRAPGFEPSPDDVRRACDFLAALGNENRLLVLCHLVEGEKTVTDLMRLVGLGQSAMSQHLARLRRNGLVQARRDGQAVRYSLIGDEVIRIMGVLYEIYCRPAGNGATPP